MAAGAPPADALAIDRQRLIGRWDIRSWREFHEDGRVIAPFGDRPRGFLRYGPDGEMICMIARPDRERFASPRQFEASAAEKARAYDGFFTYAGTYAMCPGGVTHTVEFALFPNWEGLTQVRRIAHLCANYLCLEADVRGSGLSPHRVRIEWDRAPA
jgi:hypothetical protein